MPLFILLVIAYIAFKIYCKRKYEELEAEILNEIDIANWLAVPYYDEYATVKSRQALEKYDEISFFKENKDKLAHAESVVT